MARAARPRRDGRGRRGGGACDRRTPGEGAHRQARPRPAAPSARPMGPHPGVPLPEPAPLEAAAALPGARRDAGRRPAHGEESRAPPAPAAEASRSGRRDGDAVPAPRGAFRFRALVRRGAARGGLPRPRAGDYFPEAASFSFASSISSPPPLTSFPSGSIRIVVGNACTPNCPMVLPDASSRMGKGSGLPFQAPSMMGLSFASSSSKVFARASWKARISNLSRWSLCAS